MYAYACEQGVGGCQRVPHCVWRTALRDATSSAPCVFVWSGGWKRGMYTTVGRMRWLLLMFLSFAGVSTGTQPQAHIRSRTQTLALVERSLS